MIGILAIQGDFAAHGRMLTRLGSNWREVRTPADFNGIAGLILPGGESTTMLKFFQEEGFIDPMKELAQKGGSLFGTCAGAIVLAREVSNPVQPALGLVDLSIRRNAYGRQIESFIDSALSPALGPPPLEMVFIRAPIITGVGPSLEVLVEHDSHPVLVRQGQHLMATFHPELTDDARVHQLFLNLVQQHSSVALSSR